MSPVKISQLTTFGAHLLLSTMEHLPDLEEALQRFRDPIVLGDMNMDLDKARSLRIQQGEGLLAEYGLIYLVHHFHQCRRFQNLKTWSQARQETALWSICDYIIGMDWRRFELLGI